MNKMKWKIVWLAAAALLIMPLRPSMAAVLWDAGLLAEVYNPPGDRYAYAPTVIREGNTEHMWTCHNAVDGVIKDHIFYTRIVNGVVAESRSVLQAGPDGAWDSYHVCDPTVVAGQFQYGGHTYDYAMFYLGNDVNASYHNQIGVAFADDLSGNWVKYPSPVVSYPNDGFWGVGQPSATSVDGHGHLLLFYTQGDPSATGGYRIEMNLADMANPVIGTPVAVTANGLLDANGDPDWLNNYDIVYNPANDRFVAVRELHPYPTTHPNYISSGLQVASIEGSAIWGGGGQWKVEGTLDSSVTGFARNHNGALLRTAYGTLPDPDAVTVYFTDSEAGSALSGPAEYTYDIWRIEAELTAGGALLEKKLSGFGGKPFSVERMTHDLHANRIEIHGRVDAKTLHKHQTIWIGYRLYDNTGLLLEAGTAYRNVVREDGSYTIPVTKPEGSGSAEIRLEAYALDAKGKTIGSRSGTTTFSFAP